MIIPNWNGAAFLSRCVAATILSARLTSLNHEVIVIDDASSDGSADEIARRWPEVRIERNLRNCGFGKSVNRAAKVAQGELMVLLNNDLIPRDRMISELVHPLLNDRHLFGVSGKTIEWYSAAPNHVNMAGRIVNGRFMLTYDDSRDPSPTMFLQGGSCSMRRAEFLRLGAFHRLFAPGYWEDYDISYQALKAGWRLLYNPKAIGSHLGQGSMIRAYGRDRVALVRRRNYYLFQWLNFTDPELLAEISNALPSWIARHTRHNSEDLRAFAHALLRLRHVERERLRRAALVVRHDREIFAEFANHGQLCDPSEVA